MKFLVDECTGTSVVACLRDEGHDAVAVSPVGRNYRAVVGAMIKASSWEAVMARRVDRRCWTRPQGKLDRS